MGGNVVERARMSGMSGGGEREWRVETEDVRGGKYRKGTRCEDGEDEYNVKGCRKSDAYK